MIKKVNLKRFKQFGEHSIELRPEGITLAAGGNNSGKSTILQGLAVWEFCKTAVEMERGHDAFLDGAKMQGLGLGDDEFSPVAMPSLKHLWSNLKTQKRPTDDDGYTLRVGCEWDNEAGENQQLEFGLALANDRLFVKVTSSNLQPGFGLPVIAYLPPFAGITDKEMKVSPAIRRRRTGEGLAGAVLRNLLLEMSDENAAKRALLRGENRKIKESELRNLRTTDPWELLQQTIRIRFGAELQIDPFREEYHSYIRVDIVKGVRDGYTLKRHSGYNKRDLMVEGSGFLQWLSVYALAASPAVDVLLLDEPDAHLHPTLQTQLMSSLTDLISSPQGATQAIVATHSTELLRHWDTERIMEVRSSGTRTRYLSQDSQKVGLLEGIGSDYAPRLDPIRREKRVLFVEGKTDESILRSVASTLGRKSMEGWPVWRTSKGHKERLHIFLALKEEIPGLAAVSLRDRDFEPTATAAADLTDLSNTANTGLVTLKWRRRHIENYLFHPAAVARATDTDLDDVVHRLANDHAIAVPDNYVASDCQDAILAADGKSILCGENGLLVDHGIDPADVARALNPDEVCEDFAKFFDRLDEAAPE